MLGCYGLDRKRLRVARTVLMVGVLSNCSYVPDAVNPVEWYKGAEDLVTGRDRPQIASPRQIPENTAEPDLPPTEPAKGLVADRGNVKYAQPIRREVTPTKPLARKSPVVVAQPAPVAVTAQPVVTPPPPAPQVRAEAPAVQPSRDVEIIPQPAPSAAAPVAPAAMASAPITPSPVASAPIHTARDTGPIAPPATLDMQPPPRADIPEIVAAPKLKPVQAHYQKRLAESASTVIRPEIAEAPGRAPVFGAEEPVHLVPPTKAKARGGKAVATAPDIQADPAATFQVAALDFQPGSSILNAADRANIADIAKLYRRTGGVVRVVGMASAPLLTGGDAVAQVMGGYDASMKRATAVAKELARRGVPASKIMVGADPMPGDVGAKVFLDVI